MDTTSAMLPPGKRALAIGIDTRGTSSAGGFIHPNDRVDIIRIFREDKGEEGQSQPFLSETLLTNIRVLAIGQAVQNDSGSISFQGDTAPVEVNPAQAEALTLAQRTGHLTRVLRSFADTHDPIEAAEPTARSITVTSGGSGGFSSSRFVLTQRAPADGAPKTDPATAILAPTRHADNRAIDPIFARAGGVVAADRTKWPQSALKNPPRPSDVASETPCSRRPLHGCSSCPPCRSSFPILLPSRLSLSSFRSLRRDSASSCDNASCRIPKSGPGFRMGMRQRPFPRLGNLAASRKSRLGFRNRHPGCSARIAAGRGKPHATGAAHSASRTPPQARQASSSTGATHPGARSDVAPRSTQRPIQR
jgi:hypothetical protein